MEQPAKFDGRFLLHAGKRVRVDVERDLDSFMAEPFRHHFDRNASLKQERGAGEARLNGSCVPQLSSA